MTEIKAMRPNGIVYFASELEDARKLYFRDTQRACEVCLRAALQGNGDADAVIAHMILQGSIQSNARLKDASYWVDKGIKHDSAYAHWVRASILLEEKDIDGAITSLKSALNKGFPPAAYDLGQLFQEGQFVTRDKSKARQFFLVATELGHIGARSAIYRLDQTAEIEPVRFLVSFVMFPISRLIFKVRLFMRAPRMSYDILCMTFD